MTIETVDLDPPASGEVRREIAGAGLCHSGLSTIENPRPRRLSLIGRNNEGFGNRADGAVPRPRA